MIQAGKGFPLSLSCTFSRVFHFVLVPLYQLKLHIYIHTKIYKPLSISFSLFCIIYCDENKKESAHMCAMFHVLFIHLCMLHTGLQPYTDYSFVLVACTAVGCGASSPSTRRTLQAIPAGTHTCTHTHSNILKILQNLYISQ